MTFPHCDARILHAPGECDVCDEYSSDLQEVRKVWNIAFTGHKPEGIQTPCPADLARGPESYNQWGGNVPQKGEVVGHDWAGYPVTEVDPRLNKLAGVESVQRASNRKAFMDIWNKMKGN